MMINSDIPASQALKEIADIYKEIDAAITNFKEITGLKCIHLCGKCCDVPSSRIETSILEVLPLAHNLMKTERWESILEKVNAASEESVCIFYSRDAVPGLYGRCTVYESRPLVCRLFGHSAVINKYGVKVVSLCSELKKKNEGIVEKINCIIQDGLHVPVLPEYAMRSSMIEPAISRERYPLNIAVKKAFEFLGLRNFYGGDV